MIISISDKIKTEILKNIELYEFDDKNDIKFLFGKSYGIITCFTHNNGQVYSILYTIFGDLKDFKTKLDYYPYWNLVPINYENKKDNICEYIKKYECSQYIYCLSESMNIINHTPIPITNI